MAECKRNWRVFDCDSRNTCRIANLKAGGEWATKTAQSTYWSCCDTIRTQILNWSKKCWLLRSGFCVETWCNSSVPGWNQIRNRPGNLDPLLTLLLMSGIIWDYCGLTKSKPCNWRPWGNDATILLIPRWPIASTHKCNNSVQLQSSSRSRNRRFSELWEHCTTPKYLRLWIYRHTFGEWWAWHMQSAAGQVPQWSTVLDVGMQT